MDFVLYIGATLCFAAAAIGVTAPRVNLVALGLMLWVLTNLLPAHL